MLLDRHHVATRYQIKLFGGKEVGNRGDGFVGVFDSPSRAVRCSSAIADAIAPLSIALRSGIHAGEVHLKRGEISGIAVHTVTRIAVAARPDEACVSRTVRDVMIGSELVFEDRGIHRLRGLRGEIHLYAMRELGASPTPCFINLGIGRIHEQPWQAHAAHCAPQHYSRSASQSAGIYYFDVQNRNTNVARAANAPSAVAIVGHPGKVSHRGSPTPLVYQPVRTVPMFSMCQVADSVALLQV